MSARVARRKSAHGSQHLRVAREGGSAASAMAKRYTRARNVMKGPRYLFTFEATLPLALVAILQLPLPLPALNNSGSLLSLCRSPVCHSLAGRASSAKPCVAGARANTSSTVAGRALSFESPLTHNRTAARVCFEQQQKIASVVKSTGWGIRGVRESWVANTRREKQLSPSYGARAHRNTRESRIRTCAASRRYLLGHSLRCPLKKHCARRQQRFHSKLLGLEKQSRRRRASRLGRLPIVPSPSFGSRSETPPQPKALACHCTPLARWPLRAQHCTHCESMSQARTVLKTSPPYAALHPYVSVRSSLRFSLVLGWTSPTFLRFIRAYIAPRSLACFVFAFIIALVLSIASVSSSRYIYQVATDTTIRPIHGTATLYLIARPWRAALL